MKDEGLPPPAGAGGTLRIVGRQRRRGGAGRKSPLPPPPMLTGPGWYQATVFDIPKQPFSPRRLRGVCGNDGRLLHRRRGQVRVQPVRGRRPLVQLGFHERLDRRVAREQVLPFVHNLQSARNKRGAFSLSGKRTHSNKHAGRSTTVRQRRPSSRSRTPCRRWRRAGGWRTAPPGRLRSRRRRR